MIFYHSSVYHFLDRLFNFVKLDFSFNFLVPFDWFLNSKGKLSENLVISFGKKLDEYKKKMPDCKVFLDCGAFSAKRKGFEIDLNLYIDFVKSYRCWFEVVTALDVIEDEKATWDNFDLMRQAGIENIVPVYHVKEPDNALCKLVNACNYVGFSPPTNLRGETCVDVYRATLYNCDTSLRFPDIKFHGFGVGTPYFFQIYPWYSCDGSTPALAARQGKILIIKNSNGFLELIFIFVSSKKRFEKNCYYNLDKLDRIRIDSIVEGYGYHIEDFDDDTYNIKSIGWLKRVAFNLMIFQELFVGGSFFKKIEPHPRMF